ncbi:MAG: hypothetical protein Q7J08_08920 [Methanocorpusculum sp.]|uniref:hypothetical protein n=1 Tax=Methanocorpusculum sp. TaxID=2058474 RepID=UPI0027182DC8|nr:hypothetical protein [Methanocorpusculum sp.]MDO9523812.1 hypothetical protein [Methanocorpusculum sp.]
MAILSTILLLYMDFIYDTAIEYISSNADLTNFSEFIARLFTGGGSTGGSVLSGGSTYSLYGYISYAILGVFILIYLISILVNKENTNSQLDYIILSCFLGLGFFGIIRLLIGSTGFLSFSFTFVCLIIPRIWYLNYRTPLHTKKTFIRISKYFKLGCSVLLILLLITSVTHAVNILDSTSQNNYESLNNAGSYWMENFIPKNSMKYSDFITGGLMNMLLYENKGYTYNTQLTYYSQDIIFKITKTDNTILLNEYLVINPKMISAPATNDDWSQVYPYQMAKSVINHHEINILYSSPILICR